MKSTAVFKPNKMFKVLQLTALIFFLGGLIPENNAYALSYDQKQAMSTVTRIVRNLGYRLRSPQSKNYLQQVAAKLNKIEKSLATYRIPATDRKYIVLKKNIDNLRKAVLTAIGPTTSTVAKQETPSAPVPAEKTPAKPDTKSPAPVSKTARVSNARLTYNQKRALRTVKRKLGNIKRRVQNADNLNKLLTDEKNVAQLEKALSTYHIPSNHKSSVAIQKRFTDVKQLVAKQKSTFGPVTGVATTDDKKNYAKDMLMVKDYTYRYQSGLNANEQAAILWERANAVLKWGSSLAIKHANIINADRHTLHTFNTKLKHFNNNIRAWRVSIDKVAQESIAKVKVLIARADEYAVLGQKNKTPKTFQEAIPSVLDETKHYLDFLSKTEKYKSVAADFAKSMAATRVKVKAAAKTLETQIIATARIPKEAYTGGSKAKFKQMIIAAWNKKYPSEKIHSIVFHIDQWKRNNIYRWNSTMSQWNHSDNSFITVKVVVKTSDKIATVYPAYINKNNLTKQYSANVETRRGGYYIFKMLTKNLIGS